ncbi:uncharacterized protein TNCV_2757901 [Trichonephila clavipes]|nr:uncharacterized protein TNCV_2757901 [Trichonephila clavipes]
MGPPFLREFDYGIRTAVDETTEKTPAELFLCRKLITPFQKLVMVSNGTEFAVGDILRLFEEARRNTQIQSMENGRSIIIDAGVMCKLRTATAGSDVVQSGRPIFDDFFQHLWPYIDNNTANVVFQMVKRLWLIRIDQ